MTNEELILKKLEVLDKIEKTMIVMQNDITGIKGDITGIKGDIKGIKDDIADIKETLSDHTIALNTLVAWAEDVGRVVNVPLLKV